MSSFSINDVVPPNKEEGKQEMEVVEIKDEEEMEVVEIKDEEEMEVEMVEEEEAVHRYIGDELVSIIFGNLPSLAFKFDFRCLNKTWHYRVTTQVIPPEKTGFIIEDPIGDKTTFIELNPDGNEIISSRDLNLDLRWSTIQSSCNGLLLTRKRLTGSSSIGSVNGINILQVVNALTQKTITLPQPCSRRFATIVHLWGGITFLPGTQEFKVVKLIHERGNIYCEIMTLGSPDRSWRTIGTIPGKRLLHDHPTSHNGILHFMVYSRDYLISIDTGAETMYQTNLPHQNIVLKTCHLLNMGGDNVVLIERKYNGNLFVWFLINSVTSQWGIGWCPQILYPWYIHWVEDQMTPVGTLKDGLVIVFRSYAEGDRGGLYAFSVETNEMRKIPIDIPHYSAFFPSALTAFANPKGPTQLTYPEDVQALPDVY